MTTFTRTALHETFIPKLSLTLLAADNFSASFMQLLLGSALYYQDYTPHQVHGTYHKRYATCGCYLCLLCRYARLELDLFLIQGGNVPALWTDPLWSYMLLVKYQDELPPSVSTYHCLSRNRF